MRQRKEEGYGHGGERVSASFRSLGEQSVSASSVQSDIRQHHG
jgi:hypothetical protein